MATSRGRIVIPAGANVWPHELETARALANAGHAVEFLLRSEERYVRSPDILMDGLEWEIKSPESASVKAVQKNMRKALKQAPNVVLDSRRMKKLPGNVIEREARALALEFRSLRRLIFVKKDGSVIDIK